MNSNIKFKIAEYDWEFNQINKLNYKTFVEEIPQHNINENKMLIDKFDNENTYFIALKNDTLIGMLALRDKRPFSLDLKIENLDSYIPLAKSICEIRLLSVKKEHRNSNVLIGLLEITMKYIEEKKYDMAVISGILNQQKLYKHIGFIPFGPIVGNNNAQFQPMYITHESCKIKNILKPKNLISLLPGPVEIPIYVKEAFYNNPISHRCTTFKHLFENTKKSLCNLVNAKHVEIFMGSGTLANDVICSQLSLIEGDGLILSNGEFGDRLIDHASRLDLNFKNYSIDWGTSFDLNKIEHIITENKNIKWIYMLHCETSSGILNDINSINTICKKNDILLCIDAISSIGNVPVDLSDVYLASAVSSKGLASYCGLSMVFYNHSLVPTKNKIPRYLDLYRYKNTEGIPNTISSNLVYALNESLKNLNMKEKVKNTIEVNTYIRENLKTVGLKPLLDIKSCSPAIITISIPESYNSKCIGDYLKSNGYLISYESSYLLKRNWIQLCLMGDIHKEKLESLVELFQNFKTEICSA